MMISVADVSKIIPIGFIVIALGWRYISVPIQLRKALWSPANPFERMADQSLPPEIERELSAKSQSLISLGFNPIDVFVRRMPFGRIESIYFIMFENRKAADFATLYALSARKDSDSLESSLNCIFVRAFSDKTSIVTGICCEEPSPRRASGANWLSLRASSNLSMLYTVHASRTFRHQRDRTAISIPESKPMLLDELQNAYVEDCEYYVARGYLKRTILPPGYQPSLKGAFIWGWLELWPMKSIRQFAEDRRADKELRSLGFCGICAYYDNEKLHDSAPLISGDPLAISQK